MVSTSTRAHTKASSPRSGRVSGARFGACVFRACVILWTLACLTGAAARSVGAPRPHDAPSGPQKIKLFSILGHRPPLGWLTSCNRLDDNAEVGSPLREHRAALLDLHRDLQL